MDVYGFLPPYPYSNKKYPSHFVFSSILYLGNYNAKKYYNALPPDWLWIYLYWPPPAEGHVRVMPRRQNTSLSSDIAVITLTNHVSSESCYPAALDCREGMMAFQVTLKVEIKAMLVRWSTLRLQALSSQQCLVFLGSFASSSKR